MKERITLTIFSTAILLSLVVGIVLAKENKPDGVQATAWQTARSPWFTQYIHRVVQPDPLDVGSYNSIAFNPDDNLPYISYYDATHQDLMLASPVSTVGNCGPNSDWWCRAVDGDGLEGRSTDNVGQYSSIAFWKSSGMFKTWKLGISYYDATKYSLRYAVWKCIVSCSWDYMDISVGSTTFSVGRYTSLQYDSEGNPHIAYYGSNSLGADNLFYTTYVGDGSGNCGPSNNWNCQMVDSGEGVGKYASLDLRYDDTVFIAYYAEAIGDLKYAYYGGIGNCGTGNTWICQTIDGVGLDAGAFASFIAPSNASDVFRVAYYDKTHDQLRYAHSGMGSGNGNCGPANGWQCNAVDGMSPSTPVGISMNLDLDDYPIIAYQYTNPADPQAHALLRIARPYMVYKDSDFGNCGDIPPGYLFLYWRCTTLDYAGSYTNEADYVSLAVNNSGLAVISYSEEDDYYLSTSLKFAYQRALVYLPLIIR